MALEVPSVVTSRTRESTEPPSTARCRKGYFIGTHRVVPPEETLERVMPFAPVMGITRIAMVTGLDVVGIPVAMVVRPNSRALSVSQGKGVTPAAAKASGIMESIETYHAERIDLPLSLGCLEDLRYRRSVADVWRLPMPAPSRFTPHTRILWMEAEDLTCGQRKLVPFELAHTDYTLPMPSGSGCFVASSNGLASGNHIIEATNHALCELIERDAAALWRLKHPAVAAMTKVRLDSIKDPLCRDLLCRFEDAGIAVGVWDITSDVGLPTFLCRIVPRDPSAGNGHRPASGFGCHTSKEIALCRALTEAAQSRLTFISGSRDDLWDDDHRHFLDETTIAVWRRSVSHTAAYRSWDDIPSERFGTLHEECDWIVERLGAIGITEVLRLDLTKPEFGIPVVRMIAPGLEPYGAATAYVPGERAAALVKKAA